MAWDARELVYLEADFLALSGGEIWARVEEAAWAHRERERAESATKQQEFRSRQSGRLYHRDYERAWRRTAKERMVAVRCCAVCRRLYPYTAQKRMDGTRFCSLSCAGRYRIARHAPRPPRMVTIDGVTRPLPAWAARLGITLGMVYRRMRQGMSEVEALTTPKAPRKAARAAPPPRQAPAGGRARTR